MSTLSRMALVGMAIAVAGGVVLGDSIICPAPNCDCTVLQSSTAPCATGVTLCTGVTPVYQGGYYSCGDATHVEADWPKGCKESSWSEDAYGDRWYDEITNCNEVNTNCSRSTRCQVVGSPPRCEPTPGGQFGDWTVQKKPTISQCVAP